MELIVSDLPIEAIHTYFMKEKKKKKKTQLPYLLITISIYQQPVDDFYVHVQQKTLCHTGSQYYKRR